MAERDGVDEIVEQWRRERPELDPSPIGVVGRAVSYTHLTLPTTPYV